jgi:hypothetical protein
MKKVIYIVLALIFTPFTYADHHGEPQYAALEGIFCDYNKGKDLSDLLKVASGWNAWADDNISSNYSAWIMTPTIHNNEDFPNDYFWLGVADNHEGMGSVHDEWMAKGAKQQAKFDSVASCGSQNMMTGLMARPFKSSTGHAFVQISGCDLAEGKTMGDVMAADKEWVKWMDEVGMPGGLLRWLPAIGGARDDTTDLYSIFITESMTDRGKAHDMMMKGGGAMLQSTYGDMMTCDMPRIYHSTPVGGKSTS